MARDMYLAAMQRKLAEVDMKINRTRTALAGGELSPHEQVRMAGELAQMQHRRDELASKLKTLQGEPERNRGRLRSEWEDDWDALVQDFEERLGRLI